MIISYFAYVLHMLLICYAAWEDPSGYKNKVSEFTAKDLIEQ